MGGLDLDSAGQRYVGGCRGGIGLLRSAAGNDRKIMCLQGSRDLPIAKAVGVMSRDFEIEVAGQSGQAIRQRQSSPHPFGLGKGHADASEDLTSVPGGTTELDAALLEIAAVHCESSRAGSQSALCVDPRLKQSAELYRQTVIPEQ